MKVLLALALCICPWPLQVEAMLVGRPISAFLPSSDASRTPGAFGFDQLHNYNTKNSYNLKSSILFAKKPLREGAVDAAAEESFDGIDDGDDDIELDQVCHMY